MIFAYILCIAAGLILGSFQLLRLNIISQLQTYSYFPFDECERGLELPTFLLVVFTVPVIAAVCYAEPWVFVDNFVTGAETPAEPQFSLFRMLAFLASLIAGEVLVDYYNYNVAAQKHAAQEAYRKNKPEFKYDPDRSDWINWRRQYANSGHPDWVPPGKESAQSKASDGIYTHPDRRKALQTLNAPTNASAKTIHRHYLKMAKKHHPDMVLNADSSTAAKERAEQRMSEINAAYEWLKNNP